MVSSPASRLVCRGCGASPPPSEPYPFRCPDAGRGDVDHVLERVLDLGTVSFPAGDRTSCGELGDRSGPDPGANPFVRYRGLLHSHHRALRGGMPDAEFVAMVAELDTTVAGVDGRGFAPTPLRRDPVVSDALGFGPRGGVWIKDETGNVAGSHKARHLMGVLLHLEVAERLGLAGTRPRPDLAIASCGNAALAAAILAAATGRTLRVFVPEGADPALVGRLADLGADVVVCARTGAAGGDPAYAALRGAVAAGALAFTCQGNENGLVIEGGETLAYEMVWDLRAEGVTLDHLVVQVGGGALASACVHALTESRALGALGALPRVHAVQTAGAHPLERAYHRVRALLHGPVTAPDLAAAMRTAATHRSRFMWPWEQPPAGLASGILDDETYDWVAVVEGMLASGGRPVVVDDARLAEAHALGHDAGHHASPTGTAGLAGLVDLVVDGTVGPDDRVGVLFTGTDR